MECTYNPQFNRFEYLKDVKATREIDLCTFLMYVRDGFVKTLIEKIRAESNEDEQKTLKAKLANVTISGTFSGTRSDANLLKHSGLIQIDFDYVQDIDEYKSLLYADPFTLAGFVSPRGNGLKLVVKIPECKTSEEHKNYFLALEKYYKDTYGSEFQIDESCKNVGRVFYMSYDSSLFYNNSAQVFSRKYIAPKPVTTQQPIYTNEIKENAVKRSVERSIANAVGLVRDAQKGEVWNKLRSASVLLGGLVGGGFLSAYEAERVLEQEIAQKPNARIEEDRKTIKNGIQHGQKEPITKNQIEQEIAAWIATQPKTQNTKTPTLQVKAPSNFTSSPVEKEAAQDHNYDALTNFFPYELATDLNDIAEAMDFRPNLLYFGVLSAISSQIGLTHKIELSNGWSQYASLFCAGVGDASIGKSPTFQFAFKPIKYFQEKEEERYAAAREEFNLAQFENEKLPKKDRALLEEPTSRTFITNDITIESLGIEHKNNEKGLLVFVDELAGWVKSFARYTQAGGGADSKKWLSIWSNEYIATNRVGRDKIFLKRSFISVVGGIQPKILDSMAQGGLDVDGFLFRFLFEFGFKDEPANWKKMKLAKTMVGDKAKNYYEILNKLSNLQMSDEPVTLYTSEGADEVWGEYFDDLELQQHENRKQGNDVLNSILGKMSIYTSRFALIAEMIAWACGESQLNCISQTSMRKAVALSKYYTKNSLRALQVISDAKDEREEERSKPASSVDWRAVFGEKDKLETAEIATAIMQKYGKSEKTAKRWIKAELDKVSHGVWSFRKN